MKGYKIYFDEETERFKHETVLSEVGVTGENFGLYPVWIDTPAHAQSATNSLNSDLDTGVISVLHCKSCKERFLLTADEKKWFEDRNLMAPTRCPTCRKKRKLALERERERIKELELEEREA